jgi:ribonuclease HI
MRQLRTPGYGKQLATIFLRTFQNASGLSQPLLQYPTIRAPHLEGHFYVHIRRFLANNGASLEIECIPKPVDERQGDEYIMDIVCTPAKATEVDRKYLRQYTDAEIRQLHYCRSYLQVTRISDLCTADGVFILPSITKGERSIRQCASKLEEIKQERPGEAMWTIWRTFLRTICKDNKDNEYGQTITKQNMEENKQEEEKHSMGTTITKYWSGIPYIGSVIRIIGKYYRIKYEDGDEEDLNHKEVNKYMRKNRGEGRMTSEVGQRMRLRVKLGDWNITANESDRLWPFYYSNNNDTLYRSYRKDWHKQGQFNYDCHQRTENKTYDYGSVGYIKELPADTVPTDVMDTEQGWRLSGYLPMMEHEHIRTSYETCQEFIMSQEEHISQYYTQIDYFMVPIKIYELFKSTNKVLIATDGGAVPFKGSLGFVFADEEGNIILSCYGQPSGNDPLSFRSEICAFLAAIRLVKLITQYYDEKIPCKELGRSKIQVYTDSASMIKKLKAYDKYPTAKLAMVLDSEWDVLSALHKALKWFKTYPKISWVKSHQDDKVYDATEMPLNAYLNSEADELATIGLKRLQEKPVVPMDPDTVIQFHIKGRTITRDFKRTVREIVQLPPLRKFYCERFGWSENIFDSIDWDIFRPVYKKHLASKGIQWFHKYCIKKLPTGERIHKRDHFHDKRCASCWHTTEDDDHLLKCKKRKSQRKQIIKQINILRNTVDPVLCDILKEGLTSYFMGECTTTTMLRIRGQEWMNRYSLLIDEQLVIGWDNLLRGKFSKQWKIQQKSYITRRRLKNPALHARKLRKKKREQEKSKSKENNNGKMKKKNKTEAFHSFYQSIVPFIMEIWTDRCIDRNTPVLGGRIVAEYDSLSKRVTQLYTMRELVLPEDEMKIFGEPLEEKLEDTNQQLKKWLLRWRPVIDHSMKRVKELAKENSKPIWQHFTANKPAKTTVSRKITKKKHTKPKKMSDNPLTNVYNRMQKKRSSSRVTVTKTVRYTKTPQITQMYVKLRNNRSTSRDKSAKEVEDQTIEDRFGDVPE